MMQANRLTYDDLVRMPDDGLRHELIDGVHYVSPSPGLQHQRVAKRLFTPLLEYFEPRRLGEVFFAPLDVIFNRHDVFVPDLLIVRPPLLSPRGVEGAPLLVVEIVSTSTSRRDRTLKFHRYAELGVEHYWIVDPRRQTLECFTLRQGRFELTGEGEGDATLRSADFPGLAIDLTDLWATPL